MKLHLFEPYLYAKPGDEVRQLPISGKQWRRHGPFPILIENFDCSAPTLALSGVDLSKVKDLPLNILLGARSGAFVRLMGMRRSNNATRKLELYEL